MKYLVSIFGCILIIACKNNAVENDKQASDTANIKSFESKLISAVYFDTVACKNCMGAGTIMYLKPDSTFVREHILANQQVSYDIGKWSLTDSTLTLKTSVNPTQFKIINYTELEVLNKDKPAQDTTKPVIMRRNNVPFRPSRPVPVEGLFSAHGDTMNIYICAMDKDYAASASPAALTIKTAYTKISTQNTKPVYAYVAGHFELRPSLTDTTTSDYFIIEKFIKFEAQKTCR